MKKGAILIRKFELNADDLRGYFELRFPGL